MGRLTVVDTDKIYVQRPKIQVIVYDPEFGKKMRISDGQILYPIRATHAPGPHGGEAEVLHTSHAFSIWQNDDSDRLIGCYLILAVKNEVIWAGVFTSVQYEHSANGDSGVNQVTYQCRDLWHAVADKSLRGVMYGAGATVDHLLLYLQGEPISIPMPVVGVSTSTQSAPLLPTNKKGEIIVDIDNDSFNTGSVGLYSHSYSNTDIASLIDDVAKEKHFDMVAIRPTSLKGDTIGTIEAVNYSDVPKSIVIGAPSDGDFSTPYYLPKALSITGTSDYTGVITDIRMIGGEITQSIAVKLIPAWPTELQQELFDDPVKAYEQPHVYGGVGRIWYCDINHDSASIIPFVDNADLRFWTDSETWANHPGNNSDSCRVMEYQGSEADTSKLDDSLWKLCDSQFIITQYNKDNSVIKASRFGTLGRLGWFNKRLALVVFKEPQLKIVDKFDGSTGEYVRDYDETAPKTLVLQAMQTVGNMYYGTGHKGPYPRARWRYTSDTRFRKHVSTVETGNSNYFFKRFKLGEIGRVEQSDVPDLDMSAGMAEYALRIQKDTAKPKNNVTITISGIDRSWWLGDWIKTIIDTDGNVVKDNLDWYVREIDYNFEEIITRVSLGERVYG